MYGKRKRLYNSEYAFHFWILMANIIELKHVFDRKRKKDPRHFFSNAFLSKKIIHYLQNIYKSALSIV